MNGYKKRWKWNGWPFLAGILRWSCDGGFILLMTCGPETQASWKPGPVSPVHWVLWWLGFPSWVSSSGFGTRFWSVFRSNTGCEPFQFFFVGSGSGSYGTPSPTQGSGIGCRSVYPVFSDRVLLPGLYLSMLTRYFTEKRQRKEENEGLEYERESFCNQNPFRLVYVLP